MQMQVNTPGRRALNCGIVFLGRGIMFTYRNVRESMLGMAVCAALAGCGGGSDQAQTSSMGALDLAITDGPIDNATEVVVVFTGIELHRSNGESLSIDFNAPKRINLLALQGGVTSDLTKGAQVPVGTYDWMRLKVLATQNSQGESYIMLNTGAQYPLWIPSGAETGLKLHRPFTVAQGSTTRLAVDFDLRKSVHAPPGLAPNYMLRPTLRLLDQLQVGQLAINVNLATLTAAQLGAGVAIANCKAGLYLFAGATATPDDQDGIATDGIDPVIYRPVVYDGINSAVTVNVPFVEAGTYTVAATCNHNVDVADTNDYNPTATTGQSGFQTMKWTSVNNVAVTVNATTAVSIP
jgi:Domain of unknown function (DUF4382)